MATSFPPRRRLRSRALLSKHEVEPTHRRPFILSGYRKTDTSFFQCLKYAFVLHNDVLNFWTHFLPLLAWVMWIFAGFDIDIDLSQPYHYPLVCAWIGSCSYVLFSSTAHLLSSKSVLIHEVCFMLDYLGIAMYGLGVDIASLFYLSPSNSPFFAFKNVVFTIEVAFAVSATVIGSLSRFYWGDYRFIIRVCSYILPYVCFVGPFLHRTCHCWLYGTDCFPETAQFHLLSMFATAIAVFFYVSKVPERFLPGRFDIFFQSHQIFHVFCIINTSSHMYAFPIEIELRSKKLQQVEGAMPSWETTLLPFICAEAFGLAVVAVLGLLTWKGILVTNKANKKTH